MFLRGLDEVNKHFAKVKEDNLSRRYERNYGWGANAVGDHDEDYVFDDLFDVPNR